MKPTLFIIGGSSTAIEIRETVIRYQKDNYVEVYNVISDKETSNLPNFITDSFLIDLLKKTNEIRYILGFVNNPRLREYYIELFEKVKGIPVNIINPNSYISSSVCIGIGNYIAAYAVLSSNVIIGDFNIINYHVTIGHDVMIGHDCCFNPGARISGNVKIGNDCLLGAGSFVFQGMKIGDFSQIDAMTYIDRDIEERVICSNNFGNLRVMKRRFYE